MNFDDFTEFDKFLNYLVSLDNFSLPPGPGPSAESRIHYHTYFLPYLPPNNYFLQPLPAFLQGWWYFQQTRNIIIEKNRHLGYHFWTSGDLSGVARGNTGNVPPEIEKM